MSYDEAEDWKLYDLHYKGTKQQANAIWLELVESDAWRNFEVADNLLRFGRWKPSQDYEFQRVCRERMEHISVVYKIVADLIQKHTA